MAMSSKTKERVRRSLLDDQEGRCPDCYDYIVDAPKTIHHLQHLADGGSNRLENLVLLCPECHQWRHRFD